jgi:NADPH:quinone reductase-like Zn-dependent oxidoreductase
VVDESLVAFKPEPLTFLEAASVPLAGLTAWEALKGRSSIGAGQKVLIHGGAGGVGGYAIQLAKAAGCYVITTARALNEEYVRSLGADEVIDYESQDFSSRVHDCDIVLDTVGGKVQDKSFGVLKQGGILVSITEMPDQNKAKNHGVEATWFFLEPDGQKLASLGHLFAEGKIRPTVEHIFSLANIAEAHRMSQQGHVRGKIGIVIDPKEAYQK